MKKNSVAEQDKITVLAVDDEETNREILVGYLEMANFWPITASSGPEALTILHENPDDIHVILLDRMMPGMDGLEVLKQIKTNSRLRNIPVIMQTAAAATDQIVQGIEAGVYYYLTKPFDKQTLLAIVNSALQTYEQHRIFNETLYENLLLLDCMESGRFKLNQLEQCQKLSIYLGKMCPVSRVTGFGFSKLSYGFSEVLINALEHGNLGISYEEKTHLLNQGKDAWRDEVKRRAALPENLKKYVTVEYNHQPDTITVTIKDEGNGFKWEPFLDIDPMRCTDNHGRGIALANSIFDKLEFSENGSKVTCTVLI